MLLLHEDLGSLRTGPREVGEERKHLVELEVVVGAGEQVGLRVLLAAPERDSASLGQRPDVDVPLFEPGGGPFGATAGMEAAVAG